MFVAPWSFNSISILHFQRDVAEYIVVLHCPRMKKFLFTRDFHPRMKRVEFHPGMKFNLKENLPLSMKTCNEIYY